MSPHYLVSLSGVLFLPGGRSQKDLEEEVGRVLLPFLVIAWISLKLLLNCSILLSLPWFSTGGMKIVSLQCFSRMLRVEILTTENCANTTVVLVM